MRYLVASIAFAFASSAFAADPPVAKDSAALGSAWKDLLSADDAKATRAACLLAMTPKESVEFLAEKLRPVKVDPKRVEKLIADLRDKDFTTRETAEQELEYLGKYAKSSLEAAIKETSDAESKDRLTRLAGRIAAYEKQENFVAEEKPMNPLGGGSVSISNVNGRVTISINGKPLDLTPRIIEKLPPPAGWTRAARAIGVLEFVGTPEAVKLLETLSLGEDTAPPTKLAQDALARLKRKK